MHTDISSTESWPHRVASLLAERVRANPQIVLCLPTGTTPQPVYAELGAMVAAGELSFAECTIVLLDEFGGLAPGDPGRCDVMIERDLLRHIDHDPSRFHRLDPEADPETETARYRELVAELGLDLTLLGIGGNGHIGLNEPGSPPDSVTRRVALADATRDATARYGTKGDTRWGLTLGIAEIMASGEVWLLARGAAKTEIVARALDGEITPDVPASLLRNHPAFRAFLDDAAAGLS